MKSERVLVITHFYPPESLGGAHRWQKLIEHVPDEIDCHVICPPPSYPFGEFERSHKPIRREEINGVPVTRLWTYQPTSDSRASETNIGRILNYVIFSMIASVYTALTFWRYDTVVTASTPHTTFLPGLVGKALGHRWVVDVFDLWLDNARDLGYVEQGTFPHFVVSTLERAAITRSNHVLVITETMAERFADRYSVNRSRFTVVPFGVDRDLFEPIDVEPSVTRIIYTGNLGDCHALVPFFEAFARLDSDYELSIVGAGKRRDELEMLCEELDIDNRVVFEGVRPRREIPSLLSESAVSIVPLKKGQNLDYARPNKLLESMAVGTPYVASNVSEIKIVSQTAAAGMAVENNPEEIAAAIREITQDARKRTRMSEAGPRYIEQNHSWADLGSTVGEVLQGA